MYSDINAIMVGYRGMRDMLDSIFGKAEAERMPARPPPPPKPAVAPITLENWNTVPTESLPKLSAASFDAMFGKSTGKPN